jgi:hypothetical protein
VPEVLQRLCSFLEAKGRLETPGLLLHTFDRLAGEPLRGNQPAGEAQRRALLRHAAPVMRQLESGQQLAGDLDPHLAAGALLALLQQLPASLVPPEVRQPGGRGEPGGGGSLGWHVPARHSGWGWGGANQGSWRPGPTPAAAPLPQVADLCCVRVPTPDDAALLLEQHAGPVERAALRRVLRLLRAATGAGVMARNGITSAVELCMAMTHHLMPQLAQGGQGQGLRARRRAGEGGQAAPAQRLAAPCLPPDTPHPLHNLHAPCSGC